MAKPWVIGVASFVGGGVIASGAWTAFPPRAATPAAARTDDAGAPSKADGDDDLRKANQNLTDSLHACDRQLADLRERSHAAPAASTAEVAPERERDGGRGGRRRERGETTREDWERMAQLGVVRVRIPCIRDTPWKPNERTVNRLGLAPDDTKALEEAYAASNKRVLEQIKPLCAKALGGADVADKVGPSACIDAIQNAAKRGDPKAAKESLTHAAEVQAGKRQPGADAAPLEQLANVLAAETRAFEGDLAKKLGPEDAKRLANDPSLCTDRRVLRTTDEMPDLRGERAP